MAFGDILCCIREMITKSARTGLTAAFGVECSYRLLMNQTWHLIAAIAWHHVSVQSMLHLGYLNTEQHESGLFSGAMPTMLVQNDV